MNDDAIPDLLADKMDYSGKSVVLDEGRSQEVLWALKAEGRWQTISFSFIIQGEQTGLGPKILGLVSGSNHHDSSLFTLCDAAPFHRRRRVAGPEGSLPASRAALTSRLSRDPIIRRNY